MSIPEENRVFKSERGVRQAQQCTHKQSKSSFNSPISLEFASTKRLIYVRRVPRVSAFVLFTVGTHASAFFALHLTTRSHIEGDRNRGGFFALRVFVVCTELLSRPTQRCFLISPTVWERLFFCLERTPPLLLSHPTLR